MIQQQRIELKSVIPEEPKEKRVMWPHEHPKKEMVKESGVELSACNSVDRVSDF